MKIGKIHVIYVYIKNQKQTDELQKSQVGCVLGEVCSSNDRSLQILKLNLMILQRFSLMRLLPKLCSSKWKNANEEAKAKGLGGNLKGDGGQTGGVLVVGQGGAPTMFTYKQVL